MSEPLSYYSKASQAVLSGVLVQFKIFSLQHAHAGGGGGGGIPHGNGPIRYIT